ncbi:hypothetical protein UFOVP143_16 [uncultured Caudovirales phage]|uniref:Uncharacterized protein n=1 Tax=uncultured Caudovirales phage TaxID=2100421 RepID=A0A6J7VJJ0_9CAUD|nr:hypothetical protein UFOVP143_16 [uncultured Caudovirales phage]
MTDVDYIKIAATARHIQETVLHRASDNGIKLPAETVKAILKASINLAFTAHVPGFDVSKL